MIEFIVIGVLAGIAEDIIAVYASTGMFDWKIVGTVALVAIPFAIISKLIVDHFKPFHGKKSRLHEIKHQQRMLKGK